MPEDTSHEEFYANGINGSTGGYGFTPITNAEFGDILSKEKYPDNKAALKHRNENSALMLKILKDRLAAREEELKQTQDEAQIKQITEEIEEIKREIQARETLGVVEGVDATDLGQAGWGMIFPAKADPARKDAIIEAMSNLIRRREDQAGDLFECFEGKDGYRPEEGYMEFLARHGGSVTGPVDPKQGVPYYLLIVGSPAEIPYEFQYQLDVQYGVGRIDFGDDLESYERYARSVVMADKGDVKLPRKASFFGVANRSDETTQKSAEHLIAPLHKRFSADQDYANWEFEHISPGERTKKDGLKALLESEGRPTLLFTASHGVEFSKDEDAQRHRWHQGALLCQDWPGSIRWRKPIPQDFYFAGDDLEASTNLLGMMAFLFACYGAGTPLHDEFARVQGSPRQIADQPFVAELPRQMLSHGALAAVGHVERAWGHSFYWPGAGEQLGAFESTLARLFQGERIGWAMEYFNERCAELATALVPALDKIDAGYKGFEPDYLPGLWTGYNDARNYIVLGDPAVRLPLADTPEEVRKVLPTIEVRPPAEPATVAEPGEAEAEDRLSKPLASLSDEDWQATPPAVQQALSQSLALIKKLKARLGEWEK
jgi:hypothetical protein